MAEITKSPPSEFGYITYTALIEKDLDKYVQTVLCLHKRYSRQIYTNITMPCIFPTNLYKDFYAMHTQNTEPMTATLQAILAGSCCRLRIWATAHVRRLKMFLELSLVVLGGSLTFSMTLLGSPGIPAPTSELTMGACTNV